MKKALALASLMLSAVVMPLAAGQVIVPIASGTTANGTSFRTRIWVSNAGSSGASFTTAFIGTGLDGTTQETFGSPVAVPAGGTFLATGAAPAGKVGMVEISGGAALSVAARLELVDVNGNALSSATVPVVGSPNALAANAVTQLQGLEEDKTTGTTSDFFLVNLARSPAQCTVGAFAANRTALTPTAIITLPPLSHRTFGDLLATLAAGDIANVRLQVSCDHAFYTYAVVYEVGGPLTNILVPTANLGADLLGSGAGAGSGGGGSGDPTPPATAQTFTVSGVFLNARPGASSISYNLPLTAGVPYQEIVTEFDLYVNRWQTNLFHGVFAMRRGAAVRENRVLYDGVTIRGDNSKTELELGYQDQFVKTVGPWKQLHHYHVRVDYDVINRLITFQTFEGGVLTYTLKGPAYNFDVADNGNKVHVDFGLSGIADGAYFPPIGWIFSDLQVSMVPSN